MLFFPKAIAPEETIAIFLFSLVKTLISLQIELSHLILTRPVFSSMIEEEPILITIFQAFIKKCFY